MNWKLTFVVTGYNEEFTMIMPRTLNQRRASKIAAQCLSFKLKVRMYKIILIRIVRG